MSDKPIHEEGLSPEELEAETTAEALPERAAMSTLNVTPLDPAASTADAIGDGVATTLDAPADGADTAVPADGADTAVPADGADTAVPADGAVANAPAE